MLAGTLKAPPPPKRPSNTPTHLVAGLVGLGIVVAAAAAWFFGIEEPRQKREQVRLAEEQTKTETVNTLLRQIDEAVAEGNHLRAFELLQPEEELRTKRYPLKREWDILSRQTFDWKVDISPPDAAIEFARDATAKLVNGVVRDLKIGEHQVTILRKGYRSQTLSLRLGGLNPLPDSVTLERQSGALELGFIPQNSDVSWTIRTESLDAPGFPFSSNGDAPKTLVDLPTGIYAVEMKRAGWPDFQQTVTVQDGKTAEVRHAFREAILTVSSRQADAEIYFRPVGVNTEPEALGTITTAGGRLQSRFLSTGAYRVIGKLRNFPVQFQTILLEENSPPVEFNWSMGEIRISGNLPDAEIFEDGKHLGALKELLHPLERVSGYRTFRAEYPGLDPIEIRVEVKADQTIDAPPLNFAFSRVTFRGSPEQAEVYEGERRLGRGLPLVLPPQPTGRSASFRVEAFGYEPKTIKVASLIADELTLSVNLEPVPLGWLYMTDLPTESQVILRETESGRELERSTVTEDGKWKSKAYPEPLRVVLEVENETLLPAKSQSLDIRAGTGIKWTPALKPLGYKYRFRTNPPNAQVRVGNTQKIKTDDDGWYESEWVSVNHVSYTVSKDGYLDRKFSILGEIGQISEPDEGVIALPELKEIAPSTLPVDFRRNLVRTVVIDPGHGGKDLGARKGKAIEKELNLDVARRLGNEMQKRGWKVIHTRTNDEFVTLLGRSIIANAQTSPSVLVSIHFNSSRRNSTSGIETYYHNYRGYQLASKVHSSVVRAARRENRGVRKAKFTILYKTRWPAILLEGGFLSNNQDRREILDSSYRDALSKAIADGLENYAK